MIRRAMGVWFALLPLFAFVALCAPAAQAHDPRYSGLTIRMDGANLRATVALSVTRLNGFPTADDAAKAGAQAVATQVLSRITLRADGQPVTLEPIGVEAVPGQPALLLELTGIVHPPVHRLDIQSRLFPEDSGSRTLVIIYDRGNLKRQTMLDQGHPGTTYSLGERAQSIGAVIGEFIVTGIHHIFVGPDHILFVIGLLLLGGSLRQLLKIVTAFTIAHSITLALAALNILNPSPNVIEPLIALSIVCVGAETLVQRDGERDIRALLAFGFGFVHGFGFAGVLHEVGLPPQALAASLVSFNVGVEIAQACIVLTVAPLLALLKARSATALTRTRVIGAWLIIAAGSFWFVERVLSNSPG